MSILENVIKYGALTVTAPIWWPVMKALYMELQAAMWREGGLVGRAPTDSEIPMLEEKYRSFASPLLNESLAEYTRREEAAEVARREAKRNKGKADTSAAASPGTVQPRRRAAAGGGGGGRTVARQSGGGGGTRRQRSGGGGLRGGVVRGGATRGAGGRGGGLGGGGARRRGF